MKFVDDLKDTIQFKDEPHFQYEMLNGGIPIKYNDEVYHPLAAEFPSSPGIDLIYYSETGCIILAELKYNVKNYELSQKEAIHHYLKYKEKTLEDVLIYCEQNVYEINEENYMEFIEIFACESELSFEDLNKNNRLYSICLYNGTQPQKLKSSLTDILFIEYNKQNIRIQTCKKENKDIDNLKIYNEYENIKKKQGAQRYHRNADEINEEIKNSESQAFKELYTAAKHNEFIINYGSGIKITFKIQIKDKEGKKRSLLIANEDKIEIPGNLYYQRRNLGLDNEDIDIYFEKIRMISKNFRIDKTKAGTLKVYINIFEKDYVKKLLRILKGFRNDVMELG